MLNKYGDFSYTGKEFLINTPFIERNWYNYFYTDNYIAFTSQAGVGQSFLQDNMGRRIMPVADRGVYLIDEGYKGWNLSGISAKKEYDFYQCTHALGYTKINLTKNQIESEYGIFVPETGNENSGCEVVWVKLKNRSNKTKKVKVMYYTANLFDGGYQYQGYNTSTAKYTGEVNGINFGIDCNWNQKKQHFEAFITCGQELTGYDCAKNAFIGTYGSVFEPKALNNGGCTNSDCIAEKFGFAVQTEVEIQPNDSKFVTFVAGVVEDCNRVNFLTQRFDNETKIKREIHIINKKNTNVFGKLRIKTPDSVMDKLVNNWLKYQTNMGSRWARVRHNGFRDIASDTECLATFNPMLAKERIKRLLSYQYSNGYAPRTFINGEIKDNKFSDCTVWLTFAVYYIINELGDIDFLDEEVPFNDGTSASVFEHLRRSVDFLYNFRGLHNLIRIWGGDWNDCMNQAGLNNKGVSVWLSMAWYRANKQFHELCELKGYSDIAEQTKQRGEEIKSIIDKFGYDIRGNYYIYAYNDNGEKIGSSDCEEGKIFLNPQIWAVLSGISYCDKEKIAMESAEKELTYELGTAISTPAYTKYNSSIGTITAKSPGVQENGGVYLHSMCWKLAADAMLGKADKVREDIEKILPFRNPIVNGRAEPYTLCNCYMGRETGYRYGTPGQSWRTASGQWFLKSLVNFVFGLTPTISGLEVHPCLPEDWDSAEITKEFRGCVYHIKYEHKGKKRIMVNGNQIDGCLLPLFKGEVEVLVEV